jgi:hypothetical protein
MSIKSALCTDQEKAAETGRFFGTAEILAISGLEAEGEAERREGKGQEKIGKVRLASQSTN